ncbi:hypothetical protein M9H77_13020 [Catharanthus roseus]|uniref:Uncharacterized protein n=1 Tax=Catharanthus roseus TaxID=4058 RepID=A0ACC0BJ86_CATRO|nr:hypothetical protein M9H77_13020 [Catharanthus roseus]
MAALSPTSSSSSSTLIQEIVNFHSRKLLLQTPNLYPTQDFATPPSGFSHDPTDQNNNSFDANVVMVLSVLLCALICSLGLNSIIKCALRCSTIVSSGSSNSQSARLANTGIKKKALKLFPVINYSRDLQLPGLDNECAICLSDFSSGDKIRVLPKCNHGFHVRCIDKWLNSHSSCPTCRHCLIETCQKIIGCSSTPATTSAPAPPPPPPPPEETCVRIAPLVPEGIVRNYQT